MKADATVASQCAWFFAHCIPPEPIVVITEPDVTLTDFALAAECLVFVILLSKYGKQYDAVRGWFVLFFAATGLSALFGALVHGFFLDEQTLGNRILWPATLISLGLAALAGWFIGGHLMLAERHRQWLGWVIGLSFLTYCAAVIFVSADFAVAILYYTPAMIFMLAAFVLLYRRTRHPRSMNAVVGLMLSFVAAGVQQAKIGLHPVYFNHNAFYHLIQAIALYLLFRAALWLASSGQAETTRGPEAQ